jgi:hypothetical protein
MSKDWLHGGQQLTSHCNIYTKAVRLQVKDGAKKTYGVPSGPVIRALITSTRVSSIRKNIDEFHAIGRLFVKIESFLGCQTTTGSRLEFSPL